MKEEHKQLSLSKEIVQLAIRINCYSISPTNINQDGEVRMLWAHSLHPEISLTIVSFFSHATRLATRTSNCFTH